MRYKIWGARGSLPAPLSPNDLTDRCKQLLQGFFDAGFTSAKQIDRYLDSVTRHRLGGYGGNTPCFEGISEKQRFIIDGGTGIRQLGYELLQGPCGKGNGEVHLFFTHFHWDHLIGLPFFTPLFIPGNKIHVYAVQPDLPEVFRSVFRKPYFPVPLEQLGATIEYHRLAPREPFKLGDVTLTPYELDHPDPCWGYKIEQGGKALAYCVDTEGARASREKLAADLPLYQGVEVMIFDAQYTLTETLEKINWGHAAASIGLDIAFRENIPRVIFMHHDPASNDEKIAMAEAEARRYYKSQLKVMERLAGKDARVPGVQWSFAYEGMEFEV
jgi:phosphoribosyl 1,2-cyclic phosphodiesterase